MRTGGLLEEAMAVRFKADLGSLGVPLKKLSKDLWIVQ